MDQCRFDPNIVSHRAQNSDFFQLRICLPICVGGNGCFFANLRWIIVFLLTINESVIHETFY